MRLVTIVAHRFRWFVAVVIFGVGLVPNFAEALLVGELEQVSPTPTVYTEFIDFRTFSDNGNAVEGDVTALLHAVDIGFTSGCDDADFAGFIAGRIALMTRGFCFFSDKVINAAEAGAVGALIYNNVPGLFSGSLVDPTTIPALALSDALGNSLLAALGRGDVEIHMLVTQVVPEPATFALLGLGLAGLGFARRRKR